MMAKSLVGGLVRTTRATVLLVGLAVVLALVFGAASTATAKNGNPFVLGKANNAATKVSGLIGGMSTGSVLAVKNPSDGEALGLSVGDPAGDPAAKTVAPIKADSQARVANLNADQLDGEDSARLGQMFAVVDGRCTLVRGSGTTGVASGNFCGVRFDQDISGCAFISGVSEPTSGYHGTDRTGETWAFVGNNEPNTNYVHTANSSGRRASLPFRVAAFC
jgi:hypothetical protein